MSSRPVRHDAPGRLVILWMPAVGLDDERLVTAVAEFDGRSPDDVRIVRACRSCGSDRHGKPQVAGAGPPLHVSLGRSAGTAVVAVTDAGPVGVDLESTARGTPSVADLVTWVRTESVVKATGHGLLVDPDEIDVGPPDAPPRLGSWPTSEPVASPAWMVDLAAPEGFVAAATVLSPRRPVLVRPGGAPGA